MAEPEQKKTPARKTRIPDPNTVQRRASDPSASVWVTASAGTGKTKVLTDRVLRLLLDGNKPDNVMCLTFTRAAASVMTNRIRDELAVWSTCSDQALSMKLKKLTGKKPEADTLKRARHLFAEFLDAPGGMRIQTIHSFAQTLVRRFPIETGIPPYFDLMDDQTAAELLRESQASILRFVQKNPNDPLAQAVKMITPEVNEDDFVSLIGTVTYRRAQLQKIFDQHGGLEETVDALYDFLNAPRGVTTSDLQKQACSDAGLANQAPDIDGLRQAVQILSGGSKTDRENAAIISYWLDNPEDRVEYMDVYAGAFLTGEGEVRKRLTTKATVTAQAALEAEAKRLFDANDMIKTMNLARGTESLLRLSDAILQDYDRRKRGLNLMDFDDLINVANKLMETDTSTSWVLQKLDGHLKHILVDEAQDTNPDQWRLVSAIAKDFFKDRTKARENKNTIFVVGDEKQSIFSFQRADPKEFNHHRKEIEKLVRKTGGKWRKVDMEVAFRSSPAITQAVDAVFANPRASDGLFFEDETEDNKKVRHKPFRQGHAGLVELHPVLKAADEAPREKWSLPLAMETVSNPSYEMAEQIADQIKSWMDKGEKLPARKRAISPDDIMILVRRRSEFVDHMVRALKKRDIPVAGADRLSLREQIVVMDMVALGECLLYPRDDYKLASVLKSPFIGMTDKQLEDLALNRKTTLWETLKERASAPDATKIYKEAYDYLARAHKSLGNERPYEFYSGVLMDACPGNNKSGLNALIGRLGFEAEDPLVEFMNAVERFEKGHPPTLQGFLSWLDAGEAEVKREMDIDPENPRVHIMTAHSAKGLEAPIVILPDTTGVPSDNARARPKLLWPEGDRTVPLWVPRADLENIMFRQEREKAEQERDREYRRLLYVGMTRAEDRLYIYGYQNRKNTKEDSWYNLVREGLEQGMGNKLEFVPVEKGADEKEAEAEEQVVLRYTTPQTARPVNDGRKPVKKRKVVGVPVWARRLPKAEDVRVQKFRPSVYNASNDNNNFSAPSPLNGHSETKDQKLGILVHELFEFLPVLPEQERESAAARYLAKPAWQLDDKQQKQVLKQVMGVLKDPEFGALFGPNSRAEVSISGLVEKQGEKQLMSAQIDRLVVEDKTVLIVDYKNSRRVPKDIRDVPEKYIVQMAAYKLAVQQIYPDKDVKCAILWTRQARLQPLPEKSMQTALDKIGLKPHKAEKPTAGKQQVPKKRPSGPKM